LIERIGFREVRVEGDRILLNGVPLHIKGFNRHGAGINAAPEAGAAAQEGAAGSGEKSAKARHHDDDGD